MLLSTALDSAVITWLLICAPSSTLLAYLFLFFFSIFAPYLQILVHYSLWQYSHMLRKTCIVISWLSWVWCLTYISKIQIGCTPTSLGQGLITSKKLVLFLASISTWMEVEVRGTYGVCRSTFAKIVEKSFSYGIFA